MYRGLLILAFLGTSACAPPPVDAASVGQKRVFELYMHKNGLSRCVEEDGERWKADASCCPVGFSVGGFTVSAATEFVKEDDIKRRLYRHVVCVED